MSEQLAGLEAEPPERSRNEALYRRYRPSTFDEVIGQDHVTEPLARALRTGRTHHAYLFSGPRGCGKTSSARILARSLNCENGPTPTPCGTCESCRALASDGPGSLDVVEIDAASYGGVEETRELRERAAYGPVSSRFKVYVIDEAHMISKSGFNALLKLVEEPPDYLVFVFATTEPEKVIPTIRSRTFHYPFRLVPPGALRAHLSTICEAEGVAVDERVLSLVVRAGAGSVRDSLSVLDQLVSGAESGTVEYDEAVRLLGVTDEALLDEVVEGLAAGDGAAVFESVERVVEAGIDPRRFAADLLQRLRDLILVNAVPDAVARGLIDTPADRLSRLVDSAARLGQATLSRHADTVHEGLVEMKGTTSPRLVLELICARLLLPAVSSSDHAVLQRLERLERRLEIGTQPAPAAPAAPTPAEPVAPAAPAAPAAAVAAPAPPTSAAPADSSSDVPDSPTPQAPDATRAGATARSEHSGAEPSGGAEPTHPPGTMDLATLRRLWPDVLEAVKRRKRFAWMVLSDNATPLSLTATELTLGFRSSGSRLGFSSGGNDIHLREALLDVLGIDVTITCADTPGEGGRTAGGGQASGPSATPNRRGPEPSSREGGQASGGPSEGSLPSARSGTGSDREGDPHHDTITDPEQAAVDLVSRSLGARKIGEWDNT